jgi:N-acyl-D-aspartate/D-glutamate deacylase
VQAGGVPAMLGRLKLAETRQKICADVAIFDPADFRDRATYADPHQFPSGARTCVIVNGVLVVENSHTGALPGKVLRRDAAGDIA